MLTKSGFIKYIQCPKRLWLYKNRKDLLPEEIDLALQKRFDEGGEVEVYAYQLFLDGIMAHQNDIEQAKRQTKQLIDRGMNTIFQATITAGSLFCRADIIDFDKENKQWDIYEIKSSTQVKPIHLPDLAFQKICFEQSGLKIGKLYVIHVNNQYIRKGEINPKELLIIENVTEQVEELIDKTNSDIQSACEILDLTNEPAVEILKQCHNPYDCEFIDYCWQDIPEDSIYNIARYLSEEKLKTLLEQGILQIKDIPDDVITDEKGILHYQAAKNEQVYIDKTAIKEELKKLKYPLYFLDYETFGSTIPLFDGYRPHQNMPFQYSLGIKKSLEGSLEYYEYLSKEWGDTASGVAESLKKQIGDQGNVIVWCAGFEKGRNEEMAEHYPEYKEFFQNINERIYDLMGIFKQGYYVHKDFHASASLKKVLPVMVPRLSYQDLAIQEGETASLRWRTMVDPNTPQKEREKIYDDLLKYCRLDTLAMAEILKILEKIIEE